MFHHYLISKQNSILSPSLKSHYFVIVQCMQNVFIQLGSTYLTAATGATAPARDILFFLSFFFSFILRKNKLHTKYSIE